MPFPSPVDHILSDLSTRTCPSWMAPRSWFSFIELDKAVVHYTVEETDRLKGLDLMDRVAEELRTEVPDIVQEAVIKTIPKKKKCKKAKWLSEEALQIAEKI